MCTSAFTCVSCTSPWVHNVRSSAFSVHNGTSGRFRQCTTRLVLSWMQPKSELGKRWLTIGGPRTAGLPVVGSFSRSPQVLPNGCHLSTWGFVRRPGPTTWRSLDKLPTTGLGWPRPRSPAARPGPVEGPRSRLLGASPSLSGQRLQIKSAHIRGRGENYLRKRDPLNLPEGHFINVLSTFLANPRQTIDAISRGRAMGRHLVLAPSEGRRAPGT